MEMRNDDQVVREGIPVGTVTHHPSPVTQAWAGSCGRRSDQQSWRTIIEPVAGTRDRTNVYVNLWRRLGELIGDSRFAFML